MVVGSNKIVLTMYGFPDVMFLAVVQFCITIVGLIIAKVIDSLTLTLTLTPTLTLTLTLGR